MITNRSLQISSQGKPSLLCDITTDESGETLRDFAIFCHGYKGYKDWGCWNLVAEHFANRGIPLLKFNFSGNGTTHDRPSEFVDEEAFFNNTYTKELNETHDVIDWVWEHRDELNLDPHVRIHLVGHSRGGGIAFLGSAENAKVTSCALWAGVADFENRFPFGFELKAWRDKGVLPVTNSRTGQVLYHSYDWFEDYHRNKRRLFIRPIAKGCMKPLFVVHAMDDLAVHVSAGMKYSKWCGHAELMLLEEGGHTFGAKEPWDEDAMPEPLEKVCSATTDFILGKKKV